MGIIVHDLGDLVVPQTTTRLKMTVLPSLPLQFLFRPTGNEQALSSESASERPGELDARISIAIAESRASTFRSKYLLHVVGMAVTGPVIYLLLRAFVVASTAPLARWLLVHVLATTVLLVVYRAHLDRPPPTKRLAIDARAIATAVSGVVMGSVVWFDMASLSNPTYMFGLCACLFAFCAGTFVNLTPLAFLIRLTIFPTLLQVAVAFALVGEQLVGVSVLMFLAIVGLKPLCEARRQLGQLVALTEFERWRAEHDPMTGLLNRAGLADIDVSSHSVLYVDLDGFKAVNDIHGHAAGDLVLKETAIRLEGATTYSDSKIARLGGDEFVIVLDTTDERNVVDVASRIVATLHQPFTGGREVSASIGIAKTSQQLALSDLIARADRALYRAKADPSLSFVWSDET